jgi:GH25 family lysozyme M1 (1,4-beta-N-acetylmuramidase)
MAIVRRVLDLSHHNVVTNLQTVKSAGIWGIIHKATEGTSYIDSKYAGRKSGFLELGLLWGAYHFFHPGNVKAQLDFFLRVAGIDDHTLYALDWEVSSTGTPNEADAQQFLQYLEAATGRKGVVYSGNVAKEQISGVNAYLGAHRLWLAQYSNNPSTQASWKNNVWLWQYSDGVNGPTPHGCPGVTGEVDTNSWTGTQADLETQWSGKVVAPAPGPTPEPVAPTVITISSSVPVTLSVVAGTNVTFADAPAPAAYVNTGITATVFGGATDHETSAYDGHVITDTELGVALPDRIADPRPQVQVIANGKTAVASIVDVGPWNTDDPYWTTHSRPQAESGTDMAGRVTNKAGIDLTPALAKAVGVDGKGVVDWSFV